jgi:hypothetical protein
MIDRRALDVLGGRFELYQNDSGVAAHCSSASLAPRRE